MNALGDSQNSLSRGVNILPLEILRKKKSVKWQNIPKDVLPLPVAEMDFEIDESIKDTIINMIADSDTGYLGNVPELFNSFAQFGKTRWNWETNPELIYTCTDVGVGMVEISRQLLSKGDQVLINSPVYNNFYSWIEELECSVLDIPLLNDSLDYKLDINKITDAYQKGVKVHYLCNPQNPVGAVHSKSELEAIAELAAQYGVVVLSDEIHAPLTFSEKKFHPFLNVSPTAAEVGITVTSASKSWNLAGLKCALIVVASEKMKEVASKMPFAVHYRASLIGAFAQVEAWRAINWLDQALVTLDENRKYLDEILKDKLPKVKYRIPDASYLAWLDFSEYGVSEEISSYLEKEAKVLLSAGTFYDPKATQFARLNFATSKEIINQAISSMAKALPK